MKKIILILTLIIIIPIVIFFTALHLQNTERAWDLRELNEFLDEISDDYKYIRKTDVVELHGSVTIKIFYVGHQDLIFDENIYDKFKLFFSRVDIQERILEKMASDWPSTEVFYPDVTIGFIDTAGTSSHYLQSFNHGTAYDRPSVRKIGFQEWTEPIYYVPSEE